MHTVIGYDCEEDGELGMCLAVSQRVFDALDPQRESGSKTRTANDDGFILGIG